HDLHDRDAQILVGGRGLVTPPAAGSLAADDEINRLAQDFFQVRIGVHAIHLGQSQRTQTMLVHWLARGRGHQPVGTGVGQQVLFALFQHIPIGPASRHMAPPRKAKRASAFIAWLSCQLPLGRCLLRRYSRARVVAARTFLTTLISVNGSAVREPGVGSALASWARAPPPTANQRASPAPTTPSAPRNRPVRRKQN